MKRVTIGFLSLAVVVIGAVASAADAFVVAERGRPADVAVRCQPGVGPAGRYAAEELVRHTARMTGVTLATNEVAGARRQIVLECVPGIRYDGFRLSVTGDTLKVQASIPRGLLYGVYELLETYGGCGWFSSWTETVPTAETFAVPQNLNRLEEPAFELREPFWTDPNRHPEFGARLRKNSTRYPTGRNEDPKYGVNSFRIGAGLTAHTFEMLVPPEKYFDAHPEYFSLIRGARQKERSQLCCTNPDLQQLFVSNFMARVRAGEPDAYSYSITHNDWYGWCECPACKALDEREESHAAGELLLANLCAKALAKEFPGRWIKSCGYQWTQKRPKFMKPEPNVYTCLCTIMVDYSVPITESPFAENRKFDDDLRSWGETMRQIQVTDYSTAFFGYVLPFGDLHSIGPNYRYFHAHNVRHLFSLSAHCGYHANLCELKAYLQAKLMWNPYCDEKAVIRRFCEGYYGPAAAPTVLRYLDALEAASRARDHLKEPLITCSANTYDPALSPDFHRRGLDLWDRALAAARGTAFEYNVRMGRMGALWAVLERELCLLDPDRRTAGTATAAQAREMLDDLQLARNRGHRVVFTEGGYKKSADGLTESRDERVVRMLKNMSGAVSATDEIAAADLLDVRPYMGATCVRDAQSQSGVVVKIAPVSGGNWAAVVRTAHIVQTPGRQYRVRVRARLERKDSQGEGPAFMCGIGAKGMPEKVWKTSEMTSDWQWYDAGVWTVRADASPRQELYLGVAKASKELFLKPNPNLDAVYIDRISIRSR